MSDIVKVELSATTVTADVSRHVFEIHMPDTQYFIGEMCAEKERQSGAEETGRGVECAQRMAKAIRQAWLPVTSEPTDAAVARLKGDSLCTATTTTSVD